MPSPRLATALLAVLLLSACGSMPRGGLPKVPSTLSPPLDTMSEAEVDRRLAFLEEKLDERRDYAWYWYTGWTTFYGLGIVVESTRAGLADDKGKRGDYAIGAVKAVGGFTNLLLRPLQAKNGADFVRAQPDASVEDRRRRLAVAEEQLRINAVEAEARWSWVRHAVNVGVNAVAGVIVWKGFDAPSRGWRSFGVGTAVGEAMILSAPWQPAQDWEDYQRRFAPAASGAQVSWHLVPTDGGAAIEVNF